MNDAASRPRGKRLPPAERHAQIIATAERLIAENGFNAVSVADIASACGVAKSLVLHYFPSVSNLLAEILAALDQRAYTQIGMSAVSMVDAQTSRTSLSRIMEHSFSERQLVRLFHVLEAESLSPSHGAYEFFQQRARTIRKFHETALCWKPCPQTAAVELDAFWNGLQRLWLRDEALDFRRVWEEFCDRFFV
ncbi:AcrR family transcriptional regulator [Novosphingobium chloroacetimidivorans]|uniref:AcrR family transcriptional regulator n=1 Tax=Novosphingobium chloroacetimidivorans TaxID=1428314 RepID=A0A7W7KCF3_9SPHN|nr:TetR/AcrR family transcriptional regulator [Novosphingobium chloroacetimidivorans]MBB4860277.1 AcrR family transcriptional regulator [Novosphingobium chloroacetimidivorans]